MNTSRLQFHTDHKGFVVLFAVLISSVVLAITLGISSVAYKEVLLTSQAREANYAFFAADSGTECALYADLQKTGFGTPNVSTGPTPFDCNGGTITPNGAGPVSSFEMEFVNSETNALSCANITVNKNASVSLPDGTTASFTEIVSIGYNASCTQVANVATNPTLRIVERAIKVQYQNDAVDPSTL